MVSLFLVEDEIAMRDGIRRRIHWEEEGIDFCGEASDGELAWPMIREKKPDIVLTDIKMPFMDGLQLSALIRRDLPDTRIVILSGYSEFEYAQEALRIGVTEYLLKPVTPKDIREVIGRLAREIEEEKKSQEAQMDWIFEEQREKENHDRRKLFRALISGGMRTHEILELADGMNLALSAPRYQIIMLFVKYEADHRNQDVVEESLRTITDSVDGCFLFEDSVDSMVILLTGKSGEDLGEKREQILERMTAAVRSVGELQYYISVGEEVSRLSELHRIYRDANRVGSYRYFFTSSHIAYANTSTKDLLDDAGVRRINTESALQNGNLRGVWEDFLRTGTLPETDDFVEDVFSSVGEDNARSVLYLSYLTMDSYFSMARFLKEIGKEPAEVSEFLGDINLVMGSLKSPEDAHRYLAGCLKETIRQRDSSACRHNHQVLQSAVDYIDRSFTDETISLNAVASIVGLSPNRFSTLFSREMKMTFIEYLIGKRMERARELLMTTDLRSSEIAYRSGYKDPHYFSATFKKIHGMSPKEYRMRGKEHEGGKA